MSSQPKTWRELLTSPLTWHIVGFTVLFVVTAILAVRFSLDWIATSGRQTGVLDAKQVELKALDLQTEPLRGLDKRVEQSRKQIQEFYQKRIPANYSSIATRIGELALKGPVRLSRVQYTQKLPGADLTEISMDAGITGTYPQIMRFVNGLERDQTFFVVRAMCLTGQQGGLVNLASRSPPGSDPPMPPPADCPRLKSRMKRIRLRPPLPGRASSHGHASGN